MELAMKIVSVALIAVLGVSTAACAGNGQRAQWASEQRACANMGIDPGTDAFQNCVANLDATLDQVNRVGSD
jgi:hypothetical protein